MTRADAFPQKRQLGIMIVMTDRSLAKESSLGSEKLFAAVRTRLLPGGVQRTGECEGRITTTGSSSRRERPYSRRSHGAPVQPAAASGVLASSETSTGSACQNSR
jgi:hypothetical protein